MDDAQKRFLFVAIDKIIDTLQPKPNDITNILVRVEGRKLKGVDLDRHLSRPK